MPVLFARGERDHIARMNLFNPTALRPATGDDKQSLAERVGVLRCSSVKEPVKGLGFFDSASLSTIV
jgi:hypothetical protein